MKQEEATALVLQNTLSAIRRQRDNALNSLAETQATIIVLQAQVRELVEVAKKQGVWEKIEKELNGVVDEVVPPAGEESESETESEADAA